ncbi:Ash-like/host cell division inhibitor Icd-like protein [Citrobacter sp. NCU1]|uniref:host cell division inhibitor Icd-like protein n=1 Tax=Citrobacter TaxID=544 RepID=UPI001391FD64|nr:host cell division inhibitor Icd-like protein [Citrobacter sp. NCU1]NDO83887.1 Ash-like/host cell division inhibitor Icd-like protein [Citrobacter sp. NCU1]
MPALINSGNHQFSVINFLPRQECTGYSLKVAAKSATGRRNPCYLKAILHAPGVFFCVAALTHLNLMVWWLTVFFYFLRHIVRIMVVQAGQLSGWPVSFRAGIPTPVWATTHERRNSGGSVTRYLKEVAIMATVPVLSHPEFTFVFLAVRRTDYGARPCSVRVIADCEHTARLKLVSEFVLSFAARVPVKNPGEVAA